MAFFRKPEEYEKEAQAPTGAQEVPAGGITLTPDQLKELLLSMVAEMKKPSVQEQAKLDAEALKKSREQAARIEVGKAEEMRRTVEQSRCSHLRPDGKPRTGGQLHSDGKVHIICLGCQKEVNVYVPSGYELSAHLG